MDLLTERLRAVLKPRGQGVKFSRDYGFSRSQVQLWMKEPINPTLETLDRIAAALGQEPWELLRPEAPQACSAPAPAIEGFSTLLAELNRLRQIAERDPAYAADAVKVLRMVLAPYLREASLQAAQRDDEFGKREPK